MAVMILHEYALSATTEGKVESKFITTDDGEQFVTILGTITMLPLSVVNLDSVNQVVPYAVRALDEVKIQYGWTMSDAQDQKVTLVHVGTTVGEWKIVDTGKMQESDVGQVPFKILQKYALSATTEGKVELKFITTDSGEQFVTILGMITMLPLSVVNLDSVNQVLPYAVRALDEVKVQCGWTMSDAQDQKVTLVHVDTTVGESDFVDTGKMQESDVRQVRNRILQKYALSATTEGKVELKFITTDGGEQFVTILGMITMLPLSVVNLDSVNQVLPYAVRALDEVKVQCGWTMSDAQDQKVTLVHVDTTVGESDFADTGKMQESDVCQVRNRILYQYALSVTTNGKVELKFITTDGGEQFVTILGMITMLPLSVVNLDSVNQVLPYAVRALDKVKIQYGWTMSDAQDQKVTLVHVETTGGESKIADTGKMQESDVRQMYLQFWTIPLHHLTTPQ
ncbi:hypothetical protein HOLleu_00351 [Holothuria leucospilota]|uniref:Uncharacterized protein n=1 Tax=Holothuria leucospilota TaxID=206669 RepID=A0A9Q1CNI1_HOLLE|nr:hypothetical protein HOLleu_00351 [Holothuria leucospilota]